MASDPSQNDSDLQAQISAALARRGQRQTSGAVDPRLEPTLGLGGMGPGSARPASRQESLLDDEPVGEIPPAPVHFERDDDHHVSRPQPQVETRLKRHRNWIMFLLPVVGIPVTILIALFLYLGIEMQGEGVQDSAPLVAAPEGPEKIKPTDEGGLTVEGMDSAMLNQTNGSEAPSTAEQLLPPPEEPMTPPAPAQPATTGDGTAASETGTAPSAPAVEVPATPPPASVPTSNEAATGSSETSTGQAAAPSTTGSAETAPAAPSTSSSTTAAAPTSSTTATAAPDTTPEPAAETAPTAPATTQAASAGSYRVQLVAVKSESAAKAAWATYQKKYPDLLKSLGLTVEKIDLGGNGTFYRVQAGPLANRAAANDLCGKFSQRGQNCLVIKP
jgi:hypothetical protein